MINNLCEYQNKEGLPQDLSQSMQRKYSIKLHFRESSFISIYCLFNKTDVATRFFIPDAKDMNNAGFAFKYHKNISSCEFFNKNLVLNSSSNEKYDIQNQFHSIKDQDLCRLITNETLVLGKTKSGSGSYEQSANIYVFRDMLPLKYVYYVVFERQFIDQKIQKKIVRSIGLELRDEAAENSFIME